jgi:hypothetical protein
MTIQPPRAGRRASSIPPAPRFFPPRPSSPAWRANGLIPAQNSPIILNNVPPHLRQGVLPPPPSFNNGLRIIELPCTPPPPPPAAFNLPPKINVSSASIARYEATDSKKMSPPNYTEKEQPPGMIRVGSNDSTLLGEAKAASSVDSKAATAVNSDTEVQKKDEVKVIPSTHYLSSMKTLSFRLKSIFTPRPTISNTLTTTLNETSHFLMAYLLTANGYQLIPHSPLHPVEWTHLKTIVSQTQSHAWYETFTSLSAEEHDMLNFLLDDARGKEREILVLKVLKTDKRSKNKWVKGLVKLAGGEEKQFPQLESGRLVLVILRAEDGDDRARDGRTMIPPPRIPSPPPPPGNFGRFPSGPPGPPMPTRFSPPSRPWNGPGRLPPPPPPWMNPVPRPIQPLASNRMPRQSPPVNGALRGRDTHMTEDEATTSLTIYMAKTIRPLPAPETGLAESWLRSAVWHELYPQEEMLTRINKFKSKGVSAMDVKLRLSNEQALQITKMMADEQRRERDGRFEWTLVELSALGKKGEEVKKGKEEDAAVLHGILKRAPKAGLRALAILESLERADVAADRNDEMEQWMYEDRRRAEHRRSLAMIEPPMITCRPRRISPPPRPIRRRRARRRVYTSDSGSDSDTAYSSASSLGGISSVVSSRYGRGRRRGRRGYDSDSDSDLEDERKPDVLLIKLDPKDKGSDIVQQLLKLWTVTS